MNFKKLVACISIVTLLTSSMATVFPMIASAETTFDVTVSNDYFNVISKDVYNLAPGATEAEIILNNDSGTDRKVVHVFEVNTDEDTIEVLPGYYGIDKLDPDNLSDSSNWTDKQLTQTVAYYENNLGYNVVGAMNTALAYDSNAPYGFMVYNGVVLGTPDVHKGAQTYLVVNYDNSCELRSMTTPLTGNEKTAIPANFGWLVKDGNLVSSTVERTSSDASRSMIGIKEDGTLVFCQVDGRNAPVSTGLSNYEMGEIMLSLGCVNAVNCDGGGSSTFVSKREGETENVMRSVPSDGSERATINSVIIVSNAIPTGIFDHAVIDSQYDYYAAGASAVMTTSGVDTNGYPVDMPKDNISWTLKDNSFGVVTNGNFISNGKTGDVTIQLRYENDIVGEKTIHVVNPDVFAFTTESTVIPYGKSINIEMACTYGADNWIVGMDNAFSLTLSNEKAAILNGTAMTATSDESISGVDVVATYNANNSINATLEVTFGKGSEILFDFENGDISNFLGVDEMYDWAEKNGATAPIQSNSNYSEDADSETFLSSNIVRNGKYSLGVTLDYTDAQFASWSYNMFFYTGESEIVLRDVANGKNATTFGMWVYIPEGAAGMAMQLQGYKNPDGTGGTGAHFYFTTVSGNVKNLNSCTEADIPESRWVYATCDLTSFGDFFATYNPYGTNGREPSFIRFYVKPSTAANLTFYFDDFTLDYSAAVDDRVLPVISDIRYTTADESIALTNGMEINGTSIAFSAIVSDNVGVNLSSGKIQIDGNNLSNVSISGKYLTSEPVNLIPGTHTVSFEVCDEIGNKSIATRTFKITGDVNISLGGHNYSQLPPEVDSIYYVDIKANDISMVNKIAATLKLQTANTWEPKGIEVADGFAFSYEVDKTQGTISIVIQRNNEPINQDDAILISIPVRLWSWDGVNHVTDKAISPETQFKTGNCPIVLVDCKVIESTIEFKNNEMLASLGDRIIIETKINDIANPWHAHDESLTILDQPASCLKNGYEGRTYCKTCASVVSWGVTVSATGHTDIIENGKVVCQSCNRFNLNYNGFLKTESGWVYILEGSVVTGWVYIDGNWHFFDANGYAAVGTVTMGDRDYRFEGEQGKSLGAWDDGRYYLHLRYVKNTWLDIDGNTYYFQNDGYYAVGNRALVDNNEYIGAYRFADTGALLETIDGLFRDSISGDFHYAKNGVVQTGLGLTKIENDFYYVRSNGKVISNGTWYIGNDNSYGYPAGIYNFDDQGRMIILNGIVEVDGVLRYYINGIPQSGLGLIKIEDDYYYIRSTGVVVTNNSWYVGKDNSFGFPAGIYSFDPDGKMIILNGIVEVDGNLLYYIDGIPQSGIGLIKIEDDYYYVRSTGEIITNNSWYVGKDNSFGFPAGIYSFDPDGKMIILNGIVEVDGNLRYYIDGIPQSGLGLIKIEDDYYYVRSTGEVITNNSWYVGKDNSFGFPAGIYTFGSNGIMIN